MTNKLVITILIVLVLLTAGTGYYTFTLNRQVDNLSERLVAYENEQTARIQAIGDNISALRMQTENGLEEAGKKITDTQADISIMKSDIADTKESVTGVESAVSAVSSRVTALDERVAGAESLSKSVINAADVYQKTVKATVRITNGESTIGSGFIYDKAGRVITAYHVVDGLTAIFILMYDGSISRASVLGYCKFSDVAVLKLDTVPLCDPLPMGDSGKIHVGDPVVAIGTPGDGDNPLGLRDTLTSGIISQVNRFINVQDLYISNLIQFDAAINFGNSGCALINNACQVVGLVNARIDPILGDGIYWAIASNKVKRVADSIITKGSFAYPWIGTGISDITPEQAKDNSLATANGALITSIVSGGPAQTSGIQTGDIVTSMDGIPMRNISDLTSYLGEFKSSGDKIVLEVMRRTGKLQITVIVGTRP